jgi:phage I-like protein
MQQAMSTNAAKLLQLEQGKEALENTPKPVVEQYRSSDPVEALASQLTPRSAEWVRRNPQYATDSRLYQKMIAAHQLAVSDNIRPDTDEYFDAIEETLRIRQRQQEPRHEDASAAAAQVTQRRSAPPAAPVTRSGTGTSNRPNTVRLTAAEREMASMMQMTDQEYARNKLNLQKEGKLN